MSRLDPEPDMVRKWLLGSTTSRPDTLTPGMCDLDAMFIYQELVRRGVCRFSMLILLCLVFNKCCSEPMCGRHFDTLN